MAAKACRLVCVGKMKIPFLREGAEHYAGRIGHWRRLVTTEVRDGDAALSPVKRSGQECERILQALEPQDLPIALDGRGESLTSPQLAKFLDECDRNAPGRPCFIIGGPYGLTDAVRAKAWRMLSLSAMTLPHELARLFLLEQLYRAECILHHVPYHH